MKPLDPFAVNFTGVHLIEASAGTGKTYNIASLYVRALIEAGKTVDEILVVTYTEAATKELRDRLMRRLRDSIRVLEGAVAGSDSFLSQLKEQIRDSEKAADRLKRAVRSFDEAAIYTIHGFCRHALQDRAFESGAPFEAELIGDDSDLVREIIEDYWRQVVMEASKDPLKRPVLKFLLDKGLNPDSLTQELAGHTGKPYRTLRPEQTSLTDDFSKEISTLADLYSQLKNIWETDRSELQSLLLSDAVSGRRYRKDWLQGWLQAMDDWLQSEVPPIALFDKFERFAQSYIDESITKKSEKKGIPPPAHPFFKKADAYMETAAGLQQLDVVFKRNLFGHLVNTLDEKKEELQVFSYDDLLIHLRNALHHPERGRRLRKSLRRAYPVALADEFQDTDPIQYQIFDAIYGESEQGALFMIGDPKQSIYSFRGADIFSYLEAQSDTPDGHTYSLGYNYRSAPGLINGINTLFGSYADPFILENISYQAVKSGLESSGQLQIQGRAETPLEIRQLAGLDGDKAMSKGAANDISARDTAVQIQALLAKAQKDEAKIGGDAVQAGDIAVLVRSHRQAACIREALMEKGIKSVTHSKQSVFGTDEARELYTLLKAVAEPAREQSTSTALSTVMMGYKADELIALQEDDKQWAALLEQFGDWHAMWEDHGFASMFRSVMQQQHVAEKVVRLKGGERMLTNLNHLGELIGQEEQNTKAGMHMLLKWVLKKRNEQQKDIEEEQLRLESDENLVSVVTMHHSKGLEYPIVYCPFLWHSPRNSDFGKPLVYHEGEDHPEVYLDFLGKEDPDRSSKRMYRAREDLAEGVRLAYVAITRAKYKCVINWLFADNSAHSPLGYLLLGKDESFKSMDDTIFSEQKYEENESLFRAAIADLAAHEAISAPAVDETETETPAVSERGEIVEMVAETFSRSRPLPGGAGMTSFSSLVRSEHADFEADYRRYYDEFYEQQEPDIPESPSRSVFSFPRGPDPGTAIHQIFENIDFSDSSGREAVIRDELRRQDIDEHWLPLARKMISQTLDKSLLEGEADLKLSCIQPEEMIHELEFYFRTGKVKLKELLAIIRPDADIPHPPGGYAAEGFLKGFIDLTFRYSGRYYILDYKTNHLGNEPEDYCPESLADEMEEKMYDLQYHIYLVALHRFLKRRLPDYSYDQHIGGAFYLFLRGMNDEGEEGIYYRRPHERLIETLDNYLERNED